MTKTHKKINFENFILFLFGFGKPWWLRISKTFKKEQNSCRGGFLKEGKVIGVEKMHQIQTEIDKTTTKNQILKLLCSFCVFLENLGGLEIQDIQQRRNKLVVGKVF